MPSAKPPPRKPARTAGQEETTDPSGPAPHVLEQARKGGDAPVQPGPGDATLVYDKNKGRARGGGGDFRLVAVAGPKKGSAFTLSEARTTIGRGSDNVLVIPDISVSRLHVLVQREGERWVVVDQGSGNGTRVNGRPVSRYPLQHGDEIAMGDTVVQFVAPGGVVVKGGRQLVAPSLASAAAAEPTGAVKPRGTGLRKRLPLYSAVLAALLVAFGALVVQRKKEAEEGAREKTRQSAESSELAQERFGEGVALLKQGKWAEARDRLKLAAELDPADHEVARFLERAEAEAPRAQNLSSARAALARKDYAAARSALSAIPEDSALAEGAHDLEQQVRAALDAAVRDARARAEAGDASAAGELLGPVLAAEPSRADALAVKEAIGSPKRASPGARRERAAAGSTPVAAASPSDTADVLDAYLAGDIGLALEKARLNPRAPRLLAQLQQLDASYKEGLARLQSQRNSEALKALETAASADRAIAQGKDSRLGHEVRKSLAELHYKLGIATVGTDEGLPQAAFHLRAAVAADPANGLAQQQLGQVVARAKELYLQGYVEKDNDPQAARRAFGIVQETLPAADETAQKAKRWLDKLDGKAPREDG